jgi:peptidoglycan/xylan/chitin deacetylase (PgdA/CDA1 family)
MYHGVSKKNHFSVNGRHLTEAQFEKQLKYFKKNFKIVPLGELCKLKQANAKPSDYTIALTFDDGFLNNYKVALPLLMKYQIPATFFVCSASLDNPDYIHPSDLLDIVRVNNKNGFIEISQKRFKTIGHHLIQPETNETGYGYLDSLSYKEWLAATEKIKEKYLFKSIAQTMDDEVYKLINEADLNKMSESKYVSIGSHSHEHFNLTQLTSDELDYQLGASKVNLAKTTGTLTDSIAFPDGYYNEEVVGAAKKQGYKYLIAAGDVDPKYSNDVFPRIGIMSGASYAFNILSINKGFSRFGF